MRLYEFKKADDNIDVVVVTDGINDQKLVFITESPRGTSVPGDLTPEPPNSNNKIFEMFFNFVAGTTRMHHEFIEFALKNDLQLLQWNQGLGNEDPIELVPAEVTYDYTLTTDPTTMSFEAAGGEQTFEVKSIKTITNEGPLKGLNIDVKYKSELTGAGFKLEGNTVTAEPNTGAGKSGSVTVTQLEGDSPKTVTISLSQTTGA